MTARKFYRTFFLFAFFSLVSFSAFAQDENAPDEYEDPVQNYARNGKGDNYIIVSLMPSFPLNFGKHLKVGGAAGLGYHRFLNSWLALGADLMIGYHPTIGSNVFNFWPITFAVTFQPYVWKFEFPIKLGLGIAYETYENRKYFPGFALKPEFAVFFRTFDSWSFGIGTTFLWLPQWYSGKNKKYNFDGLFMTAQVSVRYHF